MFVQQTPARNLGGISMPTGTRKPLAEKAEVTYPAINTQLQDAIIKDIYDMPKYIFPPHRLPAGFADTDVVKNAVTSGDNPLYDGTSWTNFPALGVKEKDHERRVCDFFNEVAAKVSTVLGVPVVRKWHSIWAGEALASTGRGSKEACQRQPDCGLLPVGINAATAQRRDVPSLGEVKARKDGSSRRKASSQLAENIRLKMGAQYNCRFGLGFTWINGIVKLHRYDRAGLLVSREIDVNEDWEDFTRVVCGFAFGDDVCLGYDPAYYMKGETPMIQVNTPELGEKHFEIVQVLHNAPVIRGRGTVVLRVRDPETGEYFVVKSSWVDAARLEKEWDILAGAEDVEGIAHIIGHEAVKAPGAESDDDKDTTRAARQFIIHQSESAKKELYTKKEKQKMAATARAVDKLEDREHHRIVLKECGVPLTHFNSLPEFVSVIIGAVKAHRNMFVGKKILHRDISLRNILIRDEIPERYRSSLLIDFDYGVTIPRKPRPAQPQNDGKRASKEKDASKIAHRTGTLPFMSVRLLTGDLKTVQHEPRDDLESIMYVIIWTSISHAGPRGALRTDKTVDEKPLCMWVNDDYESCGRIKLADMISPDCFTRLLGAFHPYFARLTGLVTQLRDLMFVANISRTDLSVDEFYSRFIEILEATLRDLEASEQPTAPSAASAEPSTGMTESDAKSRGRKRSRESGSCESTTEETEETDTTEETDGTQSTVMGTRDRFAYGTYRSSKRLRMESAPPAIPGAKR